MSYTATATRGASGIAPTSLNLNIFQKSLELPTLVAPQNRPKPSPSLLTDDEDIFNLDMVTMDMDFEQAYSMYAQMQHKSAVLEAAELQRAQANMEQFGHFQHGPVQAPLHAVGVPVMSPPWSDGLYLGAQPSPQLAPTFSGDFFGDKHEDLDQFFSNTELSALEKFLHNLASNALANPHELYPQKKQPKMPLMFDLHTMGPAVERTPQPQENRDMAEKVKRDLTEAFQHHPVQNLKSFKPEPVGYELLPTPLNSRNPSSTEQNSVDMDHREQLFKREHDDSMDDDDEDDEEAQERKRKRSQKPLLTLEQKRLNHSHLEQKRRMLCKQAYKRCLRLITNVDDYRNDLVLASAVTLSKKKLKRKQINKDGLPNLLKHTALLKISHEIIKIRSKNERLRNLIEQH